MQNITISVSGVSKQLLKLNPGKAAGPDNISPRILKELHNEIAPILTDISIHLSLFQTIGKNAYVTPVYKKGPKCKPENYRPISLTCICCKVLEHIITSNTMSYIAQTIFYFTTSMGLGVGSVVRPSLSSSLRTCMTP